jgi:hypothetical protein
MANGFDDNVDGFDDNNCSQFTQFTQFTQFLDSSSYLVEIVDWSDMEKMGKNGKMKWNGSTTVHQNILSSPPKAIVQHDEIHRKLRES